jgi:pilus assembly protein TadC
LETQHSFLRTSVAILKIVSYVLGTLGVLGALVILFGKTPGSGKLASLGVLFIGGLYFLILFLIAEIIRLFISIDDRLKKIESSSQTPKREIR